MDSGPGWPAIERCLREVGGLFATKQLISPARLTNLCNGNQDSPASARLRNIRKTMALRATTLSGRDVTPMSKRRFHFIMIKPSHYDDDGYVIQFHRSAMPSNTLAALHGLAEDCRKRHILGDDVEMCFTAIDETNKRVRVSKLIRQIVRDGGSGLIGLVGVQSNQFPRAMDLARQFRAAGIQVCIGGFSPIGCLATVS